MKKVFISCFTGLVTATIIIGELIILLNSPGMQKGFSLNVSPTSVTVKKVQPGTSVWEEGLRDGDQLSYVNGYTDIDIQRLKSIGCFEAYIPQLNTFFTPEKGIKLILTNGTEIKVPFKKQSFTTVFKTIPTATFIGYCLAIFILAIGFFYTYFIYESNKNKPKDKKKRYLTSYNCYLLALIISTYRIPLTTNELYCIVAVIIFDISTAMFCLNLLYITSKIENKNSLAHIIKDILSFIILVTFIIKYALIFQNIIGYDTAPYYLFYMLSFVLTITYMTTVFLGCYIKSGILYNKTGIWLKPGSVDIVNFDNFEQTILTKETYEDVFSYANSWIIKTFNACNSGYVVVDSKKKPLVVYYKETKSSKSLFLQMLKERVKNNESAKLEIHKHNGISVSLVDENVLLGFLFIGPADKPYSENQIKIVGPLVRIITKTLMTIESDKAKKQKNQLQFAFSKYISPQLVNDIMINPDVINLGGEKQVLSVVFTDLEGFTELSDSLDPSRLVRVLNSYLTEMSEVIIALGGTIDKFEGDAILAFFGAPSPMKDHAERCCRAALGMLRMEKIINDQLLSEGLITKPLRTRMGVNTGEMIVGNIGSIKRFDYTIIGGNVNIASRIETVNKVYGTQLLISDQTWKIVKDKFNARLVDTVKLKGVSQPVTVYELLSEKKEVTVLREKMELEEI
jgi:class 3 adenylate cyclase